MLLLTSIHVSFNILHTFHGGMVTVSYQCLNCVLKINNAYASKYIITLKYSDKHLNILKLTKRQSTFAILRGSCIVSSNCRRRRLRSSSLIPSMFILDVQTTDVQMYYRCTLSKTLLHKYNQLIYITQHML
jgi:hypothetical protein